MNGYADKVVRIFLIHLLEAPDTLRTILTPCTCALFHYHTVFREATYDTDIARCCIVGLVRIVRAVNRENAAVQGVHASLRESRVLYLKIAGNTRTYLLVYFSDSLLATVDAIRNAEYATHLWRTAHKRTADGEGSVLLLGHVIHVQQSKVLGKVVALDTCEDTESGRLIVRVCSIILPSVTKVCPTCILVI